MMASAGVRLERVGRPGNWRECARLAVAPDQRRFVDDNLLALAEAFVEKMEPYALYAGEEMVGLAVLDPKPPLEEGGQIALHHFMVDARFQRRGYGRAVLREVVELARERGARRVLLRATRPATRRHASTSRSGFATRARSGERSG
jgi:diamine N-acetyltransferase